MKHILQKSAIIAIIFSVFFTLQKAKAQTVCGAGYTKAGINWDFQYYKFTDLPRSPLVYMFGKNNMRLAWGGALDTLYGVPTTNEHTGKPVVLAQVRIFVFMWETAWIRLFLGMR